MERRDADKRDVASVPSPVMIAYHFSLPPWPRPYPVERRRRRLGFARVGVEGDE